MRKLLFMAIAFLFVTTTQVLAQNGRVVKGKVTDDNGAPLAGVSVTAGSVGTQTDAAGAFTLTVPATAKNLSFSFTGFVSVTRSISGETINVSLKQDDKSLSEVVVVGYGTQRRKEVTGNIASIKGAEIANKPVQSFDQALGGRAPGVQLTVPNGVLNNPPVIRIRGTNSISLSSYPLIVIDGVPSFTGDQTSTSAAGNALASLNPADIESIDIAKDAAASAIYGSRASNGVIFVTTKKGKAGKARVSYDGWVGWTKVQRLPNLLNAEQYTTIKNEGLVNAGTYNAASNAYVYTPGVDTRWYDHVYRQGMSHSHTVNVSGANDNTNYYFSVGYSNQQGIVRKNDFTRTNILANIDQKVNKYLSFGGKVAYSNELNTAATSSGSLSGEAFATAGLGRVALVNSPNVSPYLADGVTYNVNPANGFLGVGPNKIAQVGFYNPLPTFAFNRQNSETHHLTGNAYLQLKPFSWMTLRSVYGVDYLMINNETFASGKSGEGFVANSPGGSATSIYNQRKNSVWSNTIQLDKTFFDDHNFSLLGGVEEQITTGVSYGLNRTVVSDPYYTVIQGGFANIFASGLGIGESYLYSEFGRLNYNFDRRIFLSGNVRRDGASQLGANQKYGTFWGASVGWELAREKFFENSFLGKAFSNLSLRGSYGKLGNIGGLSNYGTLSTYGAGLYGAGATLNFSNAGNPDLTWETSYKTDIGLRWGILNDRITGEIAYYKTDINGLILAVTQPPSAGLPNSILTNVGEMYNKGWEFEITASPISNKDFNWTSSFNISYNKNEVTKLAPGLNTIVASTSGLETPSITLPGYPVGMLNVTRTAGVDPAAGRRIFINAAGKQVLYQHVAPAGQFRYSYADGTAAPTVSSADAQVYKNTNPKFLGGWENTFRFREFELTAMFTFQTGFYVYYGTSAGLHDQRFWNNESDILDRWQKAGDNAKWPKPIALDNISNGSSFPLDINVYKGDFLKLRSLNLSYNVPKKIVEKAKISSARFYVSGSNLAIFTKYPGPDPEVSSNGNGSINQGIDRNTVGNGRTVTVGVNVGF